MCVCLCVCPRARACVYCARAFACPSIRPSICAPPPPPPLLWVVALDRAAACLQVRLHVRLEIQASARHLRIARSASSRRHDMPGPPCGGRADGFPVSVGAGLRACAHRHAWPLICVCSAPISAALPKVITSRSWSSNACAVLTPPLHPPQCARTHAHAHARTHTRTPHTHARTRAHTAGSRSQRMESTRRRKPRRVEPVQPIPESPRSCPRSTPPPPRPAPGPAATSWPTRHIHRRSS